MSLFAVKFWIVVLYYSLLSSNGYYMIMAITVSYLSIDVWPLSMLCVVVVVVLLCVLVCFVSYSGSLYLCKIRPDNERRMIYVATSLLYAGLFSLAQAG